MLHLRLSRSRLLLVSVIVTVGTLVAGAAVKPVAGTARDRAATWVAAHPSVKPTSLAQLAAYPATYRTALFSSLDPETKSRLAKEHLRRFLDTQQNVTTDQQRLVESMIAAFTPQFFSSVVPNTFCKDVSAAFPAGQARFILSKELGYGIEPAYTLSSAGVAVTEYVVKLRTDVNATLMADGDGFPTCNCDGSGQCECFPPGIVQCCNNTPDFWVCKPPQSNDCGCWWQTSHGCDGLCDCPWGQQ